MAAALLRKSEYFDNQPDDFFDKAAALMQKMDVKSGDILIQEGQPVDKILVLESGSVVRTKSNPSTKESVTVDSLSTGAVSGLLHLLGPAPEADFSFASLTADGDASVHAIPRESFNKFISENPAYALALMGKMTVLIRANSKLVRQLKMKTSGGTGGGIRVLCYDSSAWVRDNFTRRAAEYNETAPEGFKMSFDYTSDTLSTTSATNSAGYDVICLFVNDDAGAETLKTVSMCGVKMIAMRCAGFDRVDKSMAETLGLTVARVPAYSPYAVAEHAVAVFMALNRKIHRAVQRVKEYNFLLDGLVGFDLHGKTVGLMGTGKIGCCLADIMLGFGVTLLCHDPYPNEGLKKKGGVYVDPDELWAKSDVVFLFTPLMPSTHHLFNASVLPKLKKGMVLINTSRGGLVDTEALIEGLRSGVVSAAGLDVYEHEAAYFFRDHSNTPLQDPLLQELTSFNNVILTAHQAFFTQEAIDAITLTSINNIKLWKEGKTGRDHPTSIF